MFISNTSMFGINSAYNALGNDYTRTANKAGQAAEEQGAVKSQELRSLLRNLNSVKDPNENPYVMKTEDLVNSLYKSDDDSEDKEDKLLNNYKYNYKEVTTKIQRAKTSVSAGEAVLAAKRKVSEIKRKIALKNGDAKELQLALTHAKRIEMVAKKKKHHLELEELIEHTSKRDERMEQEEESSSGIRETVLDAAQEKLSKAEDEIFEERQELFDDLSSEMKERGEELNNDLMNELSEMVSELGEDMMKQLEETMEMLEDMEVVDPHMSEEDFEDLKRKHRIAENKAIMKADMDYLKEIIKYTLESGSGSVGSAQTGISDVSCLSPAAIDITIPAGDIGGSEAAENVSFDVSL